MQANSSAGRGASSMFFCHYIDPKFYKINWNNMLRNYFGREMKLKRHTQKQKTNIDGYPLASLSAGDAAKSS